MTHRSAPTDTMRRRTPLLQQGTFALFGAAVVIKTNYTSILREAENAGFLPVTGKNGASSTVWEIVGTKGVDGIAGWECGVTVGDHSLYLNMGPEQWFAFDLETHDGAGFVTIRDSVSEYDTNTERYFLSIAHFVGASLRSPERESS